MRFIGALIVLVLAGLAFHWCAGEIAVQTLGLETRARVESVSKSTGIRHTSYTAHYEFVTEDMSKGYGSCPSHRGAEGGSVRVRYLRHDPSFNTPAVWWYAGFWMLAFGAPAWLLALWSARLLLFRRIRRPGEPEEDDDNDAADNAADNQKSAETASDDAAPAPAVDVGPVPFRNHWSAALLVSLVLSAAAIACNLAWFDAREKTFTHGQIGATPSPSHDTATPASANAPAPAAGPVIRGASLGNTANDSLLGFDGDALYYGLWRNYDDPSAPAPGLYRFALDGTGRTLIGKPGETERIYRGVQVKDEWIYYIAMDGICRIRKDGASHRHLTDNRVSSMAVVGDWVYYQHSVLDGAIFRLRLDGSSEKQLCREAVGTMCVADDGWIYYTNKTDEGRLWRMKTDGTGRARLADRRVGALLVVGNTIWFADLGRNSALCRMDPNGSGVQTVVEDSVSAINWADGWVYLCRGRGDLARCKPDGSGLESVVPIVSSVLIHAGHLFIHPDIEAKTFQRSNLDGSDLRELRF